MDYGHIVSRGWIITWDNKWLWVLGFLAGLTSTRFSSNLQSNVDSAQLESLSPEVLAAMSGALAGLVCLGFIVAVVLALLSLAARGGLITAVVKLNRAEKITLGAAFSAGAAKIWPLVGMSLLLYLPVFIAGMVVAFVIAFTLLSFAGSAMAASSFGGVFGQNPGESILIVLGLALTCSILLACVVGIAAVVLRFVNAFAFRGIMLHDMGAIESISHGWQVFRQNLGESLLLAVLFFFISMGYGFLMGIVLLPFVFILFGPLWGSLISGDFTPLALSYAFVGTLCLGIVGAILLSILTTWQSASFTLAYQYFTKKMGFLKGQPGKV